MRLFPWTLLLVCVTLATAGCRSKPRPSADSAAPVPQLLPDTPTLSADSLDMDGMRWIATGHVVFQDGDMRITAASAEAQVAPEWARVQVHFAGQVTVETAGHTVTCDTASYDTESPVVTMAGQVTIEDDMVRLTEIESATLDRETGKLTTTSGRPRLIIKPDASP